MPKSDDELTAGAVRLVNDHLGEFPRTRRPRPWWPSCSELAEIKAFKAENRLPEGKSVVVFSRSAESTPSGHQSRPDSRGWHAC